ncbi:DUF1211 domain-containing protein [bacterium]|nr:MAG: DUF1211 domain-containing protein [bacterium]
MGKGRFEAFSDAVIAILLTIMVLELKVPHGSDFRALTPLLPVFLSYVLSFVYLGIYWNNHHHMIHATRHITGRMLWPNLHLLFWLSLVPFVTGWMGENHFAAVPMAAYGFVLLMSALSWTILQTVIIREDGEGSAVARAFRRTLKGMLSPVFYVLGIASAFVSPWLSGAFYVAVALMWLVPDRRAEREIHRSATETP